MHIVASFDAVISPLLPTEYLEEQLCVFLDSGQTSRFSSFWKAFKGLAAIQNVSEPCWSGNQATDLFKIWLAQDFAHVSISSARPASPQAQPFSWYFGTSFPVRPETRKCRGARKLKTEQERVGIKDLFLNRDEGLTLVQEWHFSSEQIQTFLGNLRSEWRLYLAKDSGISKNLAFSLEPKYKCLLIFWLIQYCAVR